MRRTWRRRDLTINALAQASDGRIIDPYGGQQDLQRRILRHVSPAFVEDPLRVLRVARFAARFAPQGFRVAEETLELMRRLSAGDELEHLSPERVWQEFHRALASAAPLTFIRLLDQVGACAKLLPELCALPTDAEAASQRLWQAGGDADQQFAPAAEPGQPDGNSNRRHGHDRGFLSPPARAQPAAVTWRCSCAFTTSSCATLRGSAPSSACS